MALSAQIGYIVPQSMKYIMYGRGKHKHIINEAIH